MEGCRHLEDEKICQTNAKIGVDILVNNFKNSIQQLTKLANEAYTLMLSKIQECTSNEIKTLKDKTQSIKNNADGCTSFF